MTPEARVSIKKLLHELFRLRDLVSTYNRLRRHFSQSWVTFTVSVFKKSKNTRYTAEGKWWCVVVEVHSENPNRCSTWQRRNRVNHTRPCPKSTENRKYWTRIQTPIFTLYPLVYETQIKKYTVTISACVTFACTLFHRDTGRCVNLSFPAVFAQK